MSKVWRVEMNSGARASLVADGERKEIWRPQTMGREHFFKFLPEGRLIDEKVVTAMLDLWD